jgi:sulfur-carrier protein
MPVRVRMFAALREAAGERETMVDPGPLSELLAMLRARYGERFATRLSLCSVLIDGSSVPQHAEIDIPDGAELALLPPVSGGARQARGSALAPRGRGNARPKPSVRRRRAISWPRFAMPAALGALALAALVGGPTPFAVFVVVAAGAVMLDAVGLFARSGARPVVAAAGSGIALPFAVAVDPDAGLRLFPTLVTGMVILACCLVLWSGRGVGAATRLGATIVIGLLVGMGASSLLLLRHIPQGFRWLLGLAVLVAVTDVTGVALRRWAVIPSTWLEIAVPFAAAALACVGVWRMLAPPFEPITAMRFGLVGLLASVCGTRLEFSLGFEAGIQLTGAPPRLGEGRILASADALLLAAPAAYLLARMVAF